MINQSSKNSRLGRKKKPQTRLATKVADYGNNHWCLAAHLYAIFEMHECISQNRAAEFFCAPSKFTTA